jgi:signal transduction histidine kinase
MIFEPLYTTHDQGFGLGLAIAQRVVEMHGGYIEVESEEGKGSVFTIFFPRVPETALESVTPIGTE